MLKLNLQFFSEDDVTLILKAQANSLKSELRSVSTSTRAFKSELNSLKALSNVGVKVSGTQQIALMKKTASSLRNELTNLKRQKAIAIETGASEAALSRLDTKINYTTRDLAKLEAEARMLKFNSSGVMQFSSGLKTVGQGLTTAGQKMQRFSQVASIGVAAGVKSMFDYEKGVSRLATISGVGASENKKLANQISHTAAAMGTDPVESLEAAYQGFSSSLIKTSSAAAPTIKTMSKLAKVGGTDLTSAIDLTSTAFNAYGFKMKDMSHVMDVFLTTQNKGKTTVAELAQSMGQVLPLASSYGVKLEDVSAAYVALTKQGVNTAESTTQIKAVLASMSKPSEQLSSAMQKVGISFKDFIAQGGTLEGYLMKLKETTGGNDEEFQNLFNNLRAKQGVIGLSKDNFGLMSQAMTDVSNSTGQFNNTWNQIKSDKAVTFEQAFTRLKEAGIQMGEQLAPVLMNIANTLIGLDPTTVQTLGTAIIGLAVASPILTALGTAFTTLGTIVEGFSAIMAILDGELLLAEAPFLAIGAAITALGAAFTFIAGYIVGNGNAMKGLGIIWDSVKNIMSAVWHNVLQPIGQVLGVVLVAAAKMLGQQIQMVAQIFTVAWNTIRSVWSAAAPFFQSLWAVIKGTFSVVASVLGGFFRVAWATVKAIWSVASSFFSGIVNAIGSVFSFIDKLLGSPFRRAWSLVMNIWNAASSWFSGVVSRISGAFSGLPGRLSSFFANAVHSIENWFNSLVSFVSGIPGRIVGFFAGIGAKIKSAIGSVGGKVAEFLGFAVGGTVSAGQPIRVNEAGRQESFKDKFGNVTPIIGDYFIPPTDGRVQTAGRTKIQAQNNGGGNTISPTININNTNGLNETQVADIVMQRLEQLMN